ncbi:MAG: hypothetical protein AB8I08_37830 [Sandaracinaceae bacterium]
MIRFSAAVPALGVGLSLLLAWVSVGYAQVPSDEDVEVARELFRSGIDAAEAERWSEARIDFERAYELAPRPSTLFNLANAQIELGDLVGAATSYRLFLDTATSGPAQAYREDAETALSEIEPRIADVTVSLSRTVEGDALEVDGAPAPVDVLIPMNPGSHHLSVRRGSEVVGELDLVLVEGEERGVTMPVRAPETVLDVTPPPPAEPAEDIAASPWLWVGIGAGLAVIAAVVIGVVFATSGAEPPYEGNFGPGTVSFE